MNTFCDVHSNGGELKVNQDTVKENRYSLPSTYQALTKHLPSRQTVLWREVYPDYTRKRNLYLHLKPLLCNQVNHQLKRYTKEKTMCTGMRLLHNFHWNENYMYVVYGLIERLNFTWNIHTTDRDYIIVHKLTQRYIKHWNIKHWNIKHWNIKHWNIKHWNIKHWNIKHWNIKHWNIKHWT